MKKAVLFIAGIAFRDEEYFDTKAALENSGITTITASHKAGPCLGKLGGKAFADIELEELARLEPDAVIIVGGPGIYEYFHNKDLHRVLTAAVSRNSVASGICAGAAVLAYSGILKGKKATSFSGVSKDLEANGALYTGNPLETDGRIVTADGPASASSFGRRIAELLNNG